jgi:hypothetical protein
MRMRALAFVSVLLATACGGGASAAADASPARDLTLRLSDVPRGYAIGDDSGCGDLLDGEGPERLFELARKLRPAMCSVQLERAWASASADRQPALVVSVAVVTTEDGARELLDDAIELPAYFLGNNAYQLAAEQPTLGDDARFVRTRNALVGGHIGNPGSAAIWRSGPLLGMVFAADAVATRLDERVLELAAVQQQRFDKPTPVRPSDLDDREVALDNPRLGMRIVWLGRTFAPEGLPSLELRRGFGPLGRGESPGNRIQIEYGHPGRFDDTGVTLLLWTKPSWDRFTKTKLGRLVWASPCARATRVPLRGGRAVIYAGYARGTRRPCPRAAPDRFLAHVFFPDLVVAVNMPLCFPCTAREAEPYNTLRGLRAVVRSLRERP